ASPPSQAVSPATTPAARIKATDPPGTVGRAPSSPGGRSPESGPFAGAGTMGGLGDGSFIPVLLDGLRSPGTPTTGGPAPCGRSRSEHTGAPRSVPAFAPSSERDWSTWTVWEDSVRKDNERPLRLQALGRGEAGGNRRASAIFPGHPPA